MLRVQVATDGRRASMSSTTSIITGRENKLARRSDAARLRYRMKDVLRR